MSAVAATGQGITGQEAYELDEQFHGLMVFGIEGSDDASAAALVRWLDGETPYYNHAHGEDLSCRFLVGTTIPSPREDWRVVEAQLIGCAPTTSVLCSPNCDYRAFQIFGYFADPADSTDVTSVVMFRGKFTIARPTAGKIEWGVGYIRLNLLG